MADPLRVLLVEDSEDDAALLVRELVRGGWAPRVTRVETEAEMDAALAAGPWDVVLADYDLPRFSALGALRVLRRRGLDLPFIIVSGAVGEETAVAAMKAGAHDYVMKGRLARLVPAIEREVREADDRKRRADAERALAREQDYSRLLVEGASALVVGLDPAGTVTVFNAAAESVTGLRRDEVLGRSWLEVLGQGGRCPEMLEAFRSFLATGSREEFEAPLRTAGGDERLIAWRNRALTPGGGAAGSIAFGIDLTARKRAEEERVALEAVARRADKLAALGTLAAGLAHELNNPIGIISSRIEVMLLEAEASGLPAMVREDLSVLHRNAQRVAGIAQSLLSFSRHSPSQRAPVSLNDVVRDTLQLAERQITRGGIVLTVRLDPALPLVDADASALEQVVLNLVTNARDAVPAGGEIRIETRHQGGAHASVQLVVADTGEGIGEDAMARIFDPFFSTKPRGTGLGLSVTEGIVREHGGRIDVRSAPGQGTRFTLTFPALPR